MSISLTRIMQQITGLNTFFAGPSASRDNGVVLLDTATVTWGTDGQGNIQATAAGGTLPTATGAGQVLTATGPGTTYTAQALPIGSATQGGIVEVDGTTITATAGVISAVGMTLISKQVLGSAVASVNFNNIPQTFNNLRLVIGFLITSGNSLALTFNGSSAPSYGFGLSYAASNTPEAISNFGQTQATLTPAGCAAGAVTVDFPGYTAASPYVMGVGVFGDYNTLFVGSLMIADSGITDITSITLKDSSGTALFAVGSTFSLYGY